MIVNWNAGKLLGEAIGTLQGSVGNEEYEVVLVDNNSSDGSAEKAAIDFPEVQLIRNQSNVGFGAGNRVGLGAARGEFAAIVNPDVRLPPASLERLAMLLSGKPKAAVVGPKIVGMDGRIQSGPGKFPKLYQGVPGVSRVGSCFKRVRPEGILGSGPIRCDAVMGSCFMVKRDVLDRIGGFPTDTFMYGEESILGARVKREGYETWYCPEVEVLHHDDVCADKRWQPWNKMLGKRLARIEVAKEIFTPAGFRLNCGMETLYCIARAITPFNRKMAMRKNYLLLARLYFEQLSGSGEGGSIYDAQQRIPTVRNEGGPSETARRK